MGPLKYPASLLADMGERSQERRRSPCPGEMRRVHPLMRAAAWRPAHRPLHRSTRARHLRGKKVFDLDMDFLHNGLPRKT